MPGPPDRTGPPEGAVRHPQGQEKAGFNPDGTVTDPGRARIDNTMVKAIARAFRWRKLIETGVYGTVGEIAVAEKINASYVSRVLRLTLLTPEIVEAIVAGRQLQRLTLAGLMGVFPSDWSTQQRLLTAAQTVLSATTPGTTGLPG